MNTRRHVPSRPPGFCGELAEDDGVDPRRFFDRRTTSRRPNYKNRQLCRQIEQTLNLVLSGDFEDERLHNLLVESVRPAPDASQMMVTVRDLSGDQPAPATILAQLEMVSGHLRSCVAAAIARKRAPRLLFQVNAGPPRP